MSDAANDWEWRRDALLRWFDVHKRSLPWRATRDPYLIWVSEIMCQQTRVETVVPYYDRFVRAFPTATELAKASDDDVLSLWSGLGYYRRARHLLDGVREVVAKYGGDVPRVATERRALPGVGRYTAGAIGSIAFDQPEAVVDGNVARVFTRWMAYGGELGRSSTDRWLWEAAERAVPRERPGDWNQALMELGATLCAVKSPQCDVCPVREKCAAFREGRVKDFPVPKRRAHTKEVRWVVAVATCRSARGELVWLRRVDSGLFAGTWTLPTWELSEDESDEHLDAKLRSHRVPGEIDRRGEVRHVLSHRSVNAVVVRLDVSEHGAGAGMGDDGRFFVVDGLLDEPEVGLATFTRKCLSVAMPHFGEPTST